MEQKVKLIVSIDTWDKYAEINGITIHEVIETQENGKWFIQTSDSIANVLINNKMAEKTI